MWFVQGNNLQMAEGDFGMELPVTVSGVTLGENDSLLFTFKDNANGNTILTKQFSNVSQNTVNLVFSSSESALFSVGIYVYSLDWYQSGHFMCNIILRSTLQVVDKA